MVFSLKLVKRYKELKEEAPDNLLLMQVGVFMQVMDEDEDARARTFSSHCLTGFTMGSGAYFCYAGRAVEDYNQPV